MHIKKVLSGVFIKSHQNDSLADHRLFSIQICLATWLNCSTLQMCTSCYSWASAHGPFPTSLAWLNCFFGGLVPSLLMPDDSLPNDEDTHIGTEEVIKSISQPLVAIYYSRNRSNLLSPQSRQLFWSFKQSTPKIRLNFPQTFPNKMNFAEPTRTLAR